MNKLLAILLVMTYSCKSNGQEKESQTKKYQQIFEINDNKNPENKENQFDKIYNIYFIHQKDTVLLQTEIYKKADKIKDNTFNEISTEKKVFNTANATFLIMFENKTILYIEQKENRYILLGEIKDERETFYDDSGESFETYFPTRNIEHYKGNEYIVTYFNEGEFKIGIYEITEKGITQKFLSKGCLIYDEWSEFTFYSIKNDKIMVNYLTKPEGDKIAQVELKYENGQYLLNKDQCSE